MQVLIGSHNKFMFWTAKTTEAENYSYKSALYSFNYLYTVGNAT